MAISARVTRGSTADGAGFSVHTTVPTKSADSTLATAAGRSQDPFDAEGTASAALAQIFMQAPAQQTLNRARCG
jgi:hypothetical protein